jgi:hypothetical protein
MSFEKKEPLTVFDLTNGDNSLADTIIRLARTEDDPPILFGWNTPALEFFWGKAVAFQGVLPPPAAAPIFIPINGGNVLPGLVDVDFLKSELLRYVCAQLGVLAVGVPSVLGDTVGLGCTQLQALTATSFLRGMKDSPWFQAVLAHGAPLPAPLATVHTPRPRNTRGLLDQIPTAGLLWA